MSWKDRANNVESPKPSWKDRATKVEATSPEANGGGFADAISAAFPMLQAPIAAAKLTKWAKENPEKASKLLPAAGATALTLAAGPVSIPAGVGLAAIGGAGGAGYQKVIDAMRGKGPTEPYVPGKSELEEAKDVAFTGAKEGAYQLAGGALAKVAGKAVVPLAERAWGYTKGLLNTAQKSALAEKSVRRLMAAKTPSGDAVLTPLAGAKKLSERIDEVSKNAGQGIGKFLEKQGAGFNSEEVISRLEKLRPKTKAGDPLSGGIYNEAHKKIDDAINSVKAHIKTKKLPVDKIEVGPMGEKIRIKGEAEQAIPLSFEDMNILKGKLQGLANFTKKVPGGDVDLAIAGTFREFLDESLENVSKASGASKEFAAFLKNKKLYQATENAKKAIENRISSEQGNKLITGLTDTITGVGGLAGGIASGAGIGAVLPAAAILAGKKAIEKYGAQAGARIAQAIARNPGILPNIIRLLESGVRVSNETESGR